MPTESANRQPTVVTKVPRPVESTWFWQGIWSVAWFLRAITANLTVIGRENVPKTGGCVVTCNHTPGFDYAALGYASPRQIFFMVKAEAFENPFLAWIMTNGGGIPVQRGKGDTHAVQRAIDKVVAGYPLAIFPEGTRSKDGTLQAAHTGAVRIAMHARVPIVPAVVIGGEKVSGNVGRFWKRVPLSVVFGEPLDVGGDSSDRDQVVAQTRRVMLAMAAMLPPEKRGIWADGTGKVIMSGAGREGHRHAEGASNGSNGLGAGKVGEQHEQQYDQQLDQWEGQQVAQQQVAQQQIDQQQIDYQDNQLRDEQRAVSVEGTETGSKIQG